MNLQLLIRRIKIDEDTIIKPGNILSLEEIRSDKYLTSAYYLNNDNIRVITARHLIADTISGKQFSRVQRGVDISQYAYDFILQEGRCLIFIQDGLDYSILMSIKDKRFLTFGDNRQIPFGISNFIAPRDNMMGIRDTYTYGKPIVIVEGLRDCLDLQTIYPYVLAMQTAAIPKMVQEVLYTMTDTVITAFDNDEAGDKATKRSKYLKIDTKRFQYPSDIKDFGTLSELYIRDQFRYEWFRTYIFNQLSVLIQ